MQFCTLYVSNKYKGGMITSPCTNLILSLVQRVAAVLGIGNVLAKAPGQTLTSTKNMVRAKHVDGDL